MIQHRFNLNGKFVCGAKEGYGNVSGAMVTCLKCLELTKQPTREEQLRQLANIARMQ